MEFFVSIAEYFPFFVIVIFLVGAFMLGYFFGSLKSIFDDIKSLDYDRIKQENEELKKAYIVLKK